MSTTTEETPILFSSVLKSQASGNGGTFFVRSLNLGELAEQASPVLVLDDFRVSGQPFGHHPHAGFSAVTYWKTSIFNESSLLMLPSVLPDSTAIQISS